MYNIVCDRDKSCVCVVAKGYFKEEEGLNFIRDFKETIKDINPNEYKLVLDGRELKISDPEMFVMLQGVINFYWEVGFTDVYYVKPKSPVVMMQMRNFENLIGRVELVDYEQVEEYLNSECLAY